MSYGVEVCLQVGRTGSYLLVVGELEKTLGYVADQDMVHRGTGTLPNTSNTLNKKSTRHSGPRIAANSYEQLRIAENRRNSIPYPGPYPPKYHEFKKHFAWTDFLYSVAYP